MAGGSRRKVVNISSYMWETMAGRFSAAAAASSWMAIRGDGRLFVLAMRALLLPLPGARLSSPGAVGARVAIAGSVVIAQKYMCAQRLRRKF